MSYPTLLLVLIVALALAVVVHRLMSMGPAEPVEEPATDGANFDDDLSYDGSLSTDDLEEDDVFDGDDSEDDDDEEEEEETMAEVKTYNDPKLSAAIPGGDRKALPSGVLYSVHVDAQKLRDKAPGACLIRDMATDPKGYKEIRAKHVIFRGRTDMVEMFTEPMGCVGTRDKYVALQTVDGLEYIP